VRLNDDIHVATVTSIDLLGPSGSIIGFVDKITGLTMKRPVTRIRHLNSYDRGTVIELVPSVSEVSLTCEGFLLFPDEAGISHDIINRITQESQDPYGLLDTSRFNFDMALRIRHHNVSTRGGVYYFYRCGLDNWDMGNINLDGNNIITQTVSIQVSYTGYKPIESLEVPDEIANNNSYS
jgi:hypothetical protein